MKKILIVTPAPPRSRKGNRITALRWARILRDLGHRVHIFTEFTRQKGDLLVALHALKSHPSLARFHQKNPHLPVLLSLTGTDLYGGLEDSPSMMESLEMARYIILLQEKGIAWIPEKYKEKCRVIYQSVEKNIFPSSPPQDRFQVVVSGHLRPVKDPFRTAYAS